MGDPEHFGQPVPDATPAHGIVMKWPLHPVGFGLTLLWIFLVLSSHDTIGLSVFFYLMFLAWGWVVWGMRTVKADTLTVVLCWGIVFRVCALWADPVYEDDWYRYLWDGWQLTVGQPVYGVAPMESFGDPTVPFVMNGVLDGVNYPDLPTLYGPVTELSFGLAALIKPGSLFTLKCLWLLVDLALLMGMRRFTVASNPTYTQSEYCERVFLLGKCV